MSKGNGLASSKRHQKCMRTATRALVSAAMSRSKNKTKAKRAEVKAAASHVARAACAVNVGSRRKSKRGKKFSARDFREQQKAELRALRSQPQAYERPFNPEVF